MEVAAPKRLHRHAVPVALVLVGLFMTATAIGISGGSANEAAAARGLVTTVIHFKPAPNGLAHATLDRPQPAAVPNLEQAGRDANITFEFQ